MSTEERRAVELLTRVRYGRLATTLRAMPFLAPARHIVAGGAVLLRMHGGAGYHRACHGSVVTYGADNLEAADGADADRGGRTGLWSVQLTGTARIAEPTGEELARFGAGPYRVDGQEFAPVYLRVEPQVVTVHTMECSAEQPDHHSE
ncbi:pyridoxamine 5'-phosphate oxidase family protein [Streptomyces sp. NPDC005805]|uniref:pyridoxamine 5'-phosphate oxidase family protein n=1 Tax=Streptomyces sp. NPDC005805 TaxID=3157068 RepID=UPI0033F9A635